MTDVLFQIAADAGEREWQDVAATVWPDGQRPILTHPDEFWFLFDCAWAYRVGIHPGSLT